MLYFRCINLEELCLLKDKLAWCLYADLVCLDYDGALLDACIVALMACLRSGNQTIRLIK